MPVQRHLVVVPDENGCAVVHKMKSWLQQNPNILPDHNPHAENSHLLRAALHREKGFRVVETDTEYRLIDPRLPVNTDNDVDMFGSDDQSASDQIEDISPIFSLEYQLRDFLATNLNSVSICGKRLKVFANEEGREGVEYPTEVGPIDILAIDEAGAFYVLELKRGRTPDHTIGQLTRYMGWLRKTLAKGKDVHGVIVAKSIHPNLRYAASVVPNVSLFEYEVSFLLKEAPQI